MVSSAWSRWPRCANGCVITVRIAPPTPPSTTPAAIAAKNPNQPPPEIRYVRYAPPRYSVPWARFSTSIIPNTSDSPAASVNSSSPYATPSTMLTRLASNQPITPTVAPLSAYRTAAARQPRPARRLASSPSFAERAQLADHHVGEVVAVLAYLPQVPLLDRRPVLAERPGAPRAVDLAQLAQLVLERLRGEVLAGGLDRLVQHRSRVVRRHRVARRRPAVRLRELGDELPVRRIVQAGRVVQRGLDPRGGRPLCGEHAALGEEAGGVQLVLVGQTELLVLLDELHRVGAGEEREHRLRLLLHDLLQVRLERLSADPERRPHPLTP